MTSLSRLTWSLGVDERRVSERLANWQAHRVEERLWEEDATLWPEAPPREVAERMGWLTLPATMREELAGIRAFSHGIRTEGFRHAVVLGMGGSSLAPDVFRATFRVRSGHPRLLVLDSTHPEAVAALTRKINVRRTLFLVSSKSGTTTEPLAFYRYFWELVRGSGGAPERNFAAITDAGTPLEKLAEEQRFRAIFRAPSTVGGRYSALTPFGLVPAALLGVDVRGLLDRAKAMAEACRPSKPPAENPCLSLGAVLGELAANGRDKLTFYASRSLAAFPMWVEQLVAESTGKGGKGIVPVVDEPQVGPEHYGPDRLFVVVQKRGERGAALAAHTARLEKAGHPVVRIRLDDLRDLGQEFFRWELAVASSGIVLGIDPFDQPDVELAKELARQAMAHPSAAGEAPDAPTLETAHPRELFRGLTEWLGSCRPRDYVAIQAYLAPSPAATRILKETRRRLLTRLRVATTLGFGPRFLHSTGQLHKGGPNTGLFLQLVDRPQRDLEVPGAGYTFGELIRAQALGDFQALRQKRRRVLRVDLGSEVLAGLKRLAEALRD